METSKLLLICCAVTLRVLIGIGSYSGRSTPPKFGDYEAQRHWMEVTIHLPLTEWYRNSTENNLDYWGIDYPPLSAYQSWVHGKMIKWFEPEAIEFIKSHGYESESSKLLLRWSVVLSDLLIYFPGALLFPQEIAIGLLFDPGLLLIDHGHFQYNCISLGLVLISVAAIVRNYHILGSFIFVCAFNHKHMALYYAPAFFAHLLGHCFLKRDYYQKSRKFVFLGSTVVLAMLLIWFPFLNHISDVIGRLAPVGRGVFEDYVSNFWCISSTVIKWKQWISTDVLVRICALLTLLTCLPSMLHQMYSPSKRGFLYGLAISSLSFYMFAFQVHEKSILMVTLAVNLLHPYESFLTHFFPLLASFSMFPLLEKDGVVLQYIGINLIFLSLPTSPPKGPGVTLLEWTLYGVMLILHGVRMIINPPERYPFLHDLLFSSFSFLCFTSILLYLNFQQWKLFVKRKE